MATKWQLDYIGKLKVIELRHTGELSDLLAVLAEQTADQPINHINIDQVSDDVRWHWRATIYLDLPS